jgi:hypothetical protein
MSAFGRKRTFSYSWTVKPQCRILPIFDTTAILINTVSWEINYGKQYESITD